MELVSESEGSSFLLPCARAAEFMVGFSDAQFLVDSLRWHRGVL